MSSSDSDSDGDKITDWPFRCTCNCGATDCSDDSDTDEYYGTDSEESFSDQSSSDESTINKKTIFISIFNHRTQKNKNLISDSIEIQNYRERYQKLPLKNAANIKNIWADVKIDMPVLGQVPLKRIDNELSEDKIDKKESNKKKFKKPTHLVLQKNLSSNSPASDSEQSDIANKSNKIAQPEVKQVNGKLTQTQIKKGNNEETEIKKDSELISKANVAAKDITSNQNKNPKNEPNVLDKLTKPVNDKSEIKKDNLKSNTGKIVNLPKNILTNVQPIAENSSPKKISNTSNKKSSNESNSVKANLIKASIKAVAENKIEKNEENKRKSSVASALVKEESKEEYKTAKVNPSTPNKKSISEDKNKKANFSTSTMKPSAEDKTIKVNNLVKSEVKTNAENKIEKINLVEPNTKSNAENKIGKINLVKPNTKSNTENKIQNDISINLNVKSDVKDQTSNSNLNDKKLKSEEIEFKIPNSNKIIQASKNNKKENSMNNKNLQSNEKITVKKLSKKQEKKRRQKERNLVANNRDTSTSSSKDLSVSSTKSSNDKNTKNNSNKNVKEEAANPKKGKVTKSEKNRTENKKLDESKYSEQDTEESEIEEMNTSDDNLDLLTDTENMPTFIADIIKRKEKNKQVKVKPVPETPTKNKGKKNKEHEKIKIENEQELSVNTRKRKLPIYDKNDRIYSDKYAEEGAEMIIENNLMGALESITVAMNYNPSDYRHYLNRCYCYLRMNQSAYALTDAQYVIRLCTNVGQLFIANLRAGQAAYALKNYKQAEIFFKEAIRINPENYHAPRELLRVKISHIMSLGFNEKDALMALQKYPSVLEAVGYLNKSKKNLNTSKFKRDFDIHDDFNCEDMVFASDDEEESNSFETLNRMLGYQPGKVKFQHLVAKPLNSEYLLGSSNWDKNVIPKINTDVKKTLVPTNKTANDKAIWVGSLTNDITEQMLKKKFKQFGNVVSVYRPCNEAYAFINFERSEDVTNTLINTSAHEIAGVKLTVRSAVRQK